MQNLRRRCQRESATESAGAAGGLTAHGTRDAPEAVRRRVRDTAPLLKVPGHVVLEDCTASSSASRVVDDRPAAPSGTHCRGGWLRRSSWHVPGGDSSLEIMSAKRSSVSSIIGKGSGSGPFGKSGKGRWETREGALPPIAPFAQSRPRTRVLRQLQASFIIPGTHPPCRSARIGRSGPLE